MGVLVNIGSVMGKDILNLADGTMIGKVCGVALTPDRKVAGLKVKEKKFMGNVNVVPFENVKAFGATITVNGVDGVACAEIRDALGKNVITEDGNLLGRVEELAFDSETGDVAEVVIKGDLMEHMVGGRGILPGEKIVSFGKDVVIAIEQITAEDFHIPAEEFYGDWKTMDEVLEEIDANEEILFDEDGFEQQKAEKETAEGVERTLDGISKTVEDAFSKLKTEVTSERFKEQADRFIDRLNDEAKALFVEMKTRVKNFNTESFKEELRNRVSWKEDPEESVAADIVLQLEDVTVEKPILDEDGNVIVWPGQIIGKEEVKQALRSGRLQELLDAATVSLLEEEKNEVETVMHMTAPSTDVMQEPSKDEKIVAEETAKIETAEAGISETNVEETL